MSKDMSKEWDYRVVRQTTEDGVEWLSVQEVYYDDETNEPMAHTMDLQLEADSVTELRKQIQRMLWCLDKEIVDEIESDVAEQSMENRVLSLEMENAEMRDRLMELGDKMTKIGFDGHGNTFDVKPDSSIVRMNETPEDKERKRLKALVDEKADLIAEFKRTKPKPVTGKGL